jgi:hypothetical protein
MKPGKAILLMMFGIMSLTFVPALYIHITKFIVPMYQVRGMVDPVNHATTWRPVSEILSSGYGNCKDYSLLLLNILGPEKTQMLITQKSGEATHAAVLVGGKLVLDPAFRKSATYNNYMRNRKLIRKIDYKNINSYVQRKVL